MLLLFLQFCFQAPSDSLSLIWGRLLLFLAMSPRKLMFVAETFLSNTQRLKENPTWAPFKPVLQTYSIAPALRTKILRMLLDKGFYPSVTMISWLFFEMFWKHGDQAREVFEFLVVEFPVPGWFAGASVWRYPVERVEVLLPKIDVNQRISKEYVPLRNKGRLSLFKQILISEKRRPRNASRGLPLGDKLHWAIAAAHRMRPLARSSTARRSRGRGSSARRARRRCERQGLGWSDSS
jgi:hypothetical protein